MKNYDYSELCKSPIAPLDGWHVIGAGDFIFEFRRVSGLWIIACCTVYCDQNKIWKRATDDQVRWMTTLNLIKEV